MRARPSLPIKGQVNRDGQRVEGLLGGALLVAAALLGGLVARVIDEQVAHGLGGGAEEMGAAREARLAVAEELLVGLVDEGGGAERLSGGQVADAGHGDDLELGIDGAEEGVRRVLLARLGGVEEDRDALAGARPGCASISRVHGSAPRSGRSVHQTAGLRGAGARGDAQRRSLQRPAQ
ncbi:hypothetical protein WME86_43410 [Sorangium sp. So ce1024]